jgi:hypothetical protein
MAVWMSTVTAATGMVFSRMLNNARVLERECRAGTNSANISGRIRGIRRFVIFALKEIRTLRTPCRCRAPFEVATCAGWSEYLGKIDVELPTTSCIRWGKSKWKSSPGMLANQVGTHRFGSIPKMFYMPDCNLPMHLYRQTAKK